MAKYESLKTIVSYFLDGNDKSIGDFDKAWVLAFRGLEAMHYAISAEPKTTRIKVESNLTAKLPVDYVEWSKIGLRNSVGELVPIKINNRLSTFRALQPDRLSVQADVNDLYNGFFFNYLDGTNYS